MALSSRLIHRSLNSFSVLHRSLAAASAIGALSSSSSSALRVPSLSKQSLASSQWPLLLQSRQFRPSPVSLSSSSSASEVGFEPNYTWSYEELKPRELGIDSIAGCDLNHWLIVIDFKDPRPSPEEMVRSYEETCAKALDISVEEAKRKIYACSTSNYTGFHVEVTEIESEKFNGQPGVVFVLPDSYVDPEKKEYGGDKYINGVIIPRPRSILNGKRNREQPKHGQQAGPMPNEQVNPSYPQERPTPGGLKPNLQTNPSNSQQGPTPQSYPPKQSYGLPGEGERRGPPNYPSQQNYGRPRLGEGYVPPDSYVPPKPQDYSFGQNYNPLGQGERREHMSMVASAVRNHYQHGNGGLNPSYSENYNRGDPWNFYRQEQRGFPPVDQRYCAPPRQQGDFRDDYRYYGPPQGTSYGYGIGGYRAQGPPEPYWQGPDSGCVQQGTTFSYMEDYPGHNQGQRFSQQAERNMQGANFYPQEQREFVQGYQSNHAPRYQGHFRADNQNYGPARETFYGVGGYRGHGAAEAYWQGATSRAVVQGTSYGYEQGYPWQIQGHNLSQEQLRNMQGGHYYSQEYRAFPQGGQANYTPRRQGDFRNDYRHYGPPQGTPYGHGVGEYQGHVASIAYWQGPKY